MSILARILEARRRRQTVRDLRAMSPQILLDIGIEPDRIDSSVADAMRRHPVARSQRPAFASPDLSNGAWPYPARRNC